MNPLPTSRALSVPRPDWIANAMLIGSGIAMSAMPATALRPGIFYVFLLGHLIWGLIGLMRKQRPLVLLNFALAAIDCYAIAQRTSAGWL